MCSKAHPWVKTLFAQCDGLVCPPLNNMEILTHILDGWIEDMPWARKTTIIRTKPRTQQGKKIHKKCKPKSNPRMEKHKDVRQGHGIC
jgi:hypothetical protein